METFFVSKYALSSGIDEVQGRRTDCGEYVSYGPHGFGKLGRDLHTTREAAINDARKCRDAKIASLEKQISKLQRLAFDLPSLDMEI